MFDIKILYKVVLCGKKNQIQRLVLFGYCLRRERSIAIQINGVHYLIIVGIRIIQFMISASFYLLLLIAIWLYLKCYQNITVKVLVTHE